MKKVTLKDISIATGYSINTVSHALRDKDDIAPQTKALIRKKAEEMGHISNSIASSLRSGYTHTIAVIVGDISNPHFSIMTREIAETVEKAGYSTILMNTDEDGQRERMAIQSALNKLVDGIVLCPSQHSDENVRYLQDLHVPFVLIGRRFADFDTDYVICDDEGGGYQATRCLLEHGHRKILMLNGPPRVSSAWERLAGYKKAFASFGLPVDEEMIRELPIVTGEIRESIRQIIRQRRDFTAVFAFSDLIAWVAWEVLRDAGLDIPRGCSLIGFDHIQSRLPYPYKLATVCSHKSRMSAEAANLLIDRIKNPTGKTAHIVIPTCLDTGETIAAPRL